MTPEMVDFQHRQLMELTFDELTEISKSQGKNPQEEVRGIADALKKYALVVNIINDMVKYHHVVTEERYQFVLWLYRIRTQYPQMGLFQPDFIWVIFRKMMPSKYNRRDSDIHKAVNEWCDDPAKATAKYGHISKWNTSMVTDMNELFSCKNGLQ